MWFTDRRPVEIDHLLKPRRPHRLTRHLDCGVPDTCQSARRHERTHLTPFRDGRVSCDPGVSAVIPAHMAKRWIRACPSIESATAGWNNERNGRVGCILSSGVA
jgi:hypothetical protein